MSNLIPGGSSTASKSPSRHVDAVPKTVATGMGAYLTFTDGTSLLDFGMGLGACVLGYCHEEVNVTVRSAIAEGTTFTLPSYREERTAEALLRHVPWAEQLRWAKNGTDVTTAAVRVARHATGRTQVYTMGYHGWADWSLAEPAYGVPKEVHALTNRSDTAEGYAAMVIEVAPDAVLSDDWLANIREICTAAGTILIFDEVLSGFRYRMGSASDVVPDLACFGKSIANGFPLSALVGKRELMRHLEPGGVFFSGTAFGETASLAACEATLAVMERENVPERIGVQGRRLRDGFNAAAEELGFPGRCSGDGARSIVTGLTHEQRDLFQQECADRGLLYIGSHILSLAHTEDVIDKALGIYREAMLEGEYAVLRGEPTTIPYRQQLDDARVEPYYDPSNGG